MDAKRAMDLALAGPAFVLSLPVQAAVALAISKKMGRPVVFKQERPGLHGKIFTLYKFRSMRDVDEAAGLIHDDDRLTSLGQFLRSSSLDELPTLWNVIKGDMSLVGPRPLLVRYLDRYTEEQARRHEVRPGLTGLAQVNGRNAITWDQKFSYDVTYVDDHSITGDLQIIGRTLATVLRRDGISAEGVTTMHEFGVTTSASGPASNPAQQSSVIVATTIDRSAWAFTGPLQQMLEERGFSVRVVAGKTGNYPSPSNFVDIPMERRISLLRDLLAFARWLKVLHATKPVAIVALTPKASLLGLVAAKIMRVPRRVHLLVGLPLETTPGPKGSILRISEHITSVAATITIANSPSLARAYEKQLRKPEGSIRSTIPGSDHGVDAQYFASAPDSHVDLEFEPHRIVMLFLGRITHDKGLNDLLSAVEDPALNATFSTVIVGSQDEPDSSEILARIRSSAANITVVGEVSDVRPYLQLADLLVLPSHREGFPNVVLEAAAAGVPTLTTNATGCVDAVVDGVTGWIVNAGAPSEIVAKLQALAKDRDLLTEAGHFARERAFKDFEPTAIVSQIWEMAGLDTEERFA